MISFSIDKGSNGLQYVHLMGTIPGHEPIGYKFSGTIAQVRAKLQKEFTGHLHILVSDIRSNAVSGKNPYVDNLLDELLKCEKYGCMADHMAYAREVKHIQYELHLLLMSTNSPVRLTLLLEDLHRTIAYMTESTYSFWVHTGTSKKTAA